MRAWALRITSARNGAFWFRCATGDESPKACRVGDPLLFARKEDAQEFKRVVLRGDRGYWAEEVDVP